MGLRRDTGETAFAQLLGAGAGFATGVLIARAFGTEGKGVYSIATQLTAIAAVIATIGAEQGLLYYVGRGLVRPYRRVALLRLVAAETVIVVVIGLMVAVVAPALLPSDRLPAYALITVATMLTQLGTIQLLALHQIRAVNAVTVARGALFVLAGLATLFGALTPLGVLVAGSVAGAVVVLIGNRIEHADAAPPRLLADWRAFARFGWRPQLGNLLQMGSYRLDLVIVGAVLGVSPAGVYSVALGLAEAAWLLPGSLAQVLLPRFLRLDEVDRRSLMWRSVRWSVFLTLACSLVGALLARPLVPIVFGSAFGEASNLMLLMVPGVACLAAAKQMAAYQMGAGRPQVALYVTVLSTLVTVPTYLVLIPAFGLVGAAIGSSISYAITSVIEAVFLRSRSTWSHDPGAS